MSIRRLRNLTRRATVFTMLVLGLLVVVEPAREGDVNDNLRQMTQIIHPNNPAINVECPENLGKWEGEFRLTFESFDYQPDLAANPMQEFANGFQEVNRGHVHGWVFNEQGEQIRFYGAAGTTFDGTTYIKPDTFDPGKYVAYFQLQNHDHTPTIQSNAPAFPSIKTVNFYVEDEGQEGNPPNVPNCGCGEQTCITFGSD